MLDMGPYYTTALIHLLGPVDSLCAMTQQSFETRVATCKEKKGLVIQVETPTYVAGTLRFKSGATATMVMSFETLYSTHPCIEIYGEKGTLTVPDPNTFGGPVVLYRPEEGAAREVPLMAPYKENSRALGLSDMCKAIETGRPFRANSQQQHHVLEILTGFGKSSREGRALSLKTKYERTMPMKNNPMHGILDE